MATPPRANFYDVVFDLVTTSATYGKPISNNITVTVYMAPPYAASAQTTLAAIYSSETGSTSPGNPFTLPLSGLGAGELNFWAAPGSYDIKVVDSSSPKRFADKLVRWDADPSDKGLIREMIDDSLGSQLGLSNANGPTVRRGKAIIAANESHSANVYTNLGTPDRVQNVKLDTDGIIWVAYVADANATVASGKVGLFLTNNQVQIRNGSGGNTNYGLCEAAITVNSGGYSSVTLSSTGAGGVGSGLNVVSASGGLGSNPLADIGTGMIPGSGAGYASLAWTPIVATAGTYDVAIRWQAGAGGIIQARNRKLYVKTESF